MEETYNTKAIILDRKPFKEFDTKVSVFCMDRGRQEFIARGIKKIESKLAGHLEPISLSSIMVVRGRQYNYIGSAIGENYYTNIKNNLEKLEIAGKAINVFKERVKENEEDKWLFGLLEDFLRILNNYPAKAVANYELFFYFFILKLLNELGYKPELFNCTVCKKRIAPDNNRFDLARGGVVCSSCIREDKGILTLTDNCIKVMRMIIVNDFNKLKNLNIDNKLNKEVNLVISSFYKYNF